MTVLVTGGGGFVGSHVVRELTQAGARVRCLTGPAGSAVPAPAEAIESFEADICDTEALRLHALGVELIVHLAGPPSVAESFRNPREYVRVHVQGTASVLEASRRAGVARIVYVSSGEVYGCPASNPVNEDHPLQPRSPYAAAKVEAENLLDAWRRCNGQSAIVLRPFSIYGPGASPQSLIAQIATHLKEGRDIVLRDLRPVRDYCFVSDFAHAVVCACALGADYGVFNIGTMEGVSVESLARLARKAAGSAARIIEDPSLRRPSDILELVADNRRARESLGWHPKIGLLDGLRTVLHGAMPCAS